MSNDITLPNTLTNNTLGDAEEVQDNFDTLLNEINVLNKLEEGHMLNGKIAVDATGSDLTVALKTIADADPSSDDPVYVRINGTVRVINYAVSFTVAAGSDYLEMGSSELATKETDLFAKLVYNTNTSLVSMIASRIPFGNLISEYTDSLTDEKGYLYSGTKPAATDVCIVIGRFAATLSAGAGYTWSVPTFTATNLIQEPIHETRWLDWQPVFTQSGTMTYGTVTTNRAKYKLVRNTCYISLLISGTTGGTADASIEFTVPITQTAANLIRGGCYIADTADGQAGNFRSGAGSTWSVYRYDGANWGLGASRNIGFNMGYQI